jgi:hypothetical protein
MRNRAVVRNRVLMLSVLLLVVISVIIGSVTPNQADTTVPAPVTTSPSSGP